MRLMFSAGGPRRFLRYPLLVPDQPHLTERLALRLQRFGPISCPVCGQLAYATRFGTSPLDFRDAAYCSSCLATNRQRQLAYIVCAAFATLTSILGQVVELRLVSAVGVGLAVGAAQRGGKRKRSRRLFHQGMGTLRSAKPPSMRTGW
jgi:hypothetical protein